MPVASIPLILLCSVGIPLAATTTTVGAPPSETFTLTGAAFAVFIIVAYIRMKQAHVSFWGLAFNALATAACGWLAPESVAHYMLKMEAPAPKTWGLLALMCGLAGGAFITTLIVLSHNRLPTAAERALRRLGFPPAENDPPPATETKNP